MNSFRWALLFPAGLVAIVLTWFGLMGSAFSESGWQNPIARFGFCIPRAKQHWYLRNSNHVFRPLQSRGRLHSRDRARTGFCCQRLYRVPLHSAVAYCEADGHRVEPHHHYRLGHVRARRPIDFGTSERFRNGDVDHSDDRLERQPFGGRQLRGRRERGRCWTDAASNLARRRRTTQCDGTVEFVDNSPLLHQSTGQRGSTLVRNGAVNCDKLIFVGV